MARFVQGWCVKEDLNKLFDRLDTEEASAMSDLYALTSPHLFGIITQIIPNSVEAEKVLKKVYARVWARRRVLAQRHKGDPVGYLRRLAHRSAMDSKFKMNIKAKLNPELLYGPKALFDEAKAIGISDQDIRILKLAYLNGASASDISGYEKLDIRQVEASLDRTMSYLKGGVL